ncbi:toll/interleukin-1 receptor domain-containing protein [Gramella sp. AN32]|uniref:Toll/interleukin-1 receptor domain-containing protein n=1 Tax=Christiangramia antarctica TaxID=2058158 RepID=A0ABW5XA91_9FLAO|nr:toll/interleukin-1 receptor domain-containing protein [Gramella sp. AN32]MCM4157267.1 hypothetical protein [Gramella sp. AN32]
MQYDVFICHASEDKDDFVRPLANILQKQHIEVWYDEFSLKIGDSLTQKIDEGLANSNFGIVVLSPNFFKKPWAKRELNGLNLREMVENKNLILPIWHRVNVEEVAKFSPPLADKLAGSSLNGINSLVIDLIKKIKPEQSPLVVAKEYLSKLNVETPIISDEWWLDMIEYKEFLKYPDLNSTKRWIFPLPHADNDFGKNRGLNIASTVLQIDWSFEGEELNIDPITPPEKVHEFIHRWPGLYDCARQNPEILALYVPQLTIPGFDKGFEDVFNNLLETKDSRSDIIFSYGELGTLLDKKPSCGNIIALRHPEFGNYSKSTIARTYFYAHDTNYSRSHIDAFEGLVWLLSSDSNWLPEKYREILIYGTLDNDIWIKDLTKRKPSKFFSKVWKTKRENFEYTKTIKKEIQNHIITVLEELEIKGDSKKILNKMLEIDVAEKFYDYEDYLNQLQKRLNSSS